MNAGIFDVICSKCQYGIFDGKNFVFQDSKRSRPKSVSRRPTRTPPAPPGGLSPTQSKPSTVEIDRSEIYSAADFINQPSIRKNSKERNIHQIPAPVPPKKFPKNEEFPPPPPERKTSTENSRESTSEPEIVKNLSIDTTNSLDGPPPSFPAVPVIPAPSRNSPGLVIKQSSKTSKKPEKGHLTGDKSEFEKLFQKINKNNCEKSTPLEQSENKLLSKNETKSEKPQRKPPSPPPSHKKPKNEVTKSDQPKNPSPLPVKHRLKMFAGENQPASRGASPIRSNLGQKTNSKYIDNSINKNFKNRRTNFEESVEKEEVRFGLTIRL